MGLEFVLLIVTDLVLHAIDAATESMPVDSTQQEELTVDSTSTQSTQNTSNSGTKNQPRMGLNFFLMKVTDLVLIAIDLATESMPVDSIQKEKLTVTPNRVNPHRTRGILEQS